MKMNLLLAIAVTTSCSAAFANGVEKILPADATGIELKNAALAYLPVGAESTGNELEGNPDQATGTQTVIEANFVYRSKSNLDVASTGSGLDGQITGSDDQRPQFSVYLAASDSLIAQVKSKKLSLRDAIKYSVEVKAVQVSVPTQYHCQYISTNDNGDMEKADPSCIESDGIVTESRPAVTVSLK